MNWLAFEISLAARPAGCHLVTAEIEKQLPALRQIKVGLAHLFLLHTSAGLTICENASPDVRADLAGDLARLVPENAPYYHHTVEGPDDMPAHTKSVLTGVSLTIPVRDGRFYLGTWQGIYLCEFRRHGGSRKLAVTLAGV